MKSFKSSKSLAFALLGLIVICGVVAALLLLTGDSQQKKSANTASTKENATPSTGTYSAAEVVKSPEQYAGKEMSIKGTIVQMNSKDYYAVSQDGGTSSAVKLDFSKAGLDPAKYATVAQESAGTNTSQKVVSKTYTIKGQFAKTDKAQPPLLVVHSVE